MFVVIQILNKILIMDSLNLEPAKFQKRIKKTPRHKSYKNKKPFHDKKLQRLYKITLRARNPVKTYKFRQNIWKINSLVEKAQCFKLIDYPINIFNDWHVELPIYLTKFNIDEIDVSVSKNEFFSGHYSEHLVSTIKVNKFIEYNGPFTMYIAQLPLYEKNFFTDTPKLAQILKDFQLQKFFSSKINDIDRINLWASKKPTKSALHYDSYDNFLFMIKGKKKFTIYKPNDPAIACESVITNSYQQAKLIHNKSNYKLEIYLKEGEGIFIPQGWYHQVDSWGDEGILAINIWFNSIQKICDSREKYLFRYLSHYILEKEIKKLVDQAGNNIKYQNPQEFDWNRVFENLTRENILYFEDEFRQMSPNLIREYLMKLLEFDSKKLEKILLGLDSLVVEIFTSKLETIDHDLDALEEKEIITKAEFYDKIFNAIDFSRVQEYFIESKKLLRRHIFESVIVHKMINSYHF